MSGKTPGQAAYEAWRHRVTPADKPLINLLEAWFGGLDDDSRAAWEAAAQAAIDAVSAEPPAIRTGPCPAESHVQVRTGAAWLCGHLLARLLAENGITAAPPAIVTAGAEHIAALLAEEGR